MKPYINSNYRFRPQSVACQCKVSCGIGTATCEAFPEWKGTRLAKVLPWLRRSVPLIFTGNSWLNQHFLVPAVSLSASGFWYKTNCGLFLLPSFSFYSFNPLAQWLCVLTCLILSRSMAEQIPWDAKAARKSRSLHRGWWMLKWHKWNQVEFSWILLCIYIHVIL